MNIALVGNPNAGKTSVFNQLTGLNQKIGNYPGVTVDKKTGLLKSKSNGEATVVDLPGTYSLYPKTRDEEIVYNTLTKKDNPDYPDKVVVITDASNLERNLLLYTQILDLKIPAMLVLNMSDVARKKGISIDQEKLAEVLGGIEVVSINARSGQGIDELIAKVLNLEAQGFEPFIEGEFNGQNTIPDEKTQKQFAERRFRKINQVLKFVVKEDNADYSLVRRHRLVDRFITHRIFGYVIFLAVMFLIFQAIYAWSEWPMDLIDSVFLSLSQLAKTSLPSGVFTDLIAEGIIPGLGGVLIFIPQIALLFVFIFLLEESGYMARVVFILDRVMRPFGLNGKSVVPLISGIACAIPAIMATRTIDNWKERMITIMVTPLMSCSARLPVYALLIALVIPEHSIGPFNLKGLVLMFMYLFGTVAALLVAIVLRMIIKTDQKSFLVMELPLYKMPRWKNLVFTIYEKIKVFTLEAGKVILAISILLWLLASYGPGDRMEEAVSKVDRLEFQDDNEYQQELASVQLANSYIGILGQGIEPIIKPLGFNWQIGISIITSFAAREVFVGSMATIYSVGQEFEDDSTLLERMRSEKNPDGTLVYTMASGLSLMVFYALAMQCMSTLAIVLRETKNWKWPLLQLVYMTVLAYIFSLITYQILN
jgi:ferrous iron transport protein B